MRTKKKSKVTILGTKSAWTDNPIFRFPMDEEARAKRRIESAGDDIAKKAEMLVVTSTTTRWTHRRVVDDDAYRELRAAQREYCAAVLALEDTKRIKRIALGACKGVK